ncbi:hypothetical protein [Alteribacter natronophilus]|uniref:hypothetical protein n=1 Tax=Alteribacter natronophilus TaxID=2583810 RepID=UPI00110E5444|nr:hypothetical protein [Alteribacter natronophilus]TMW71062.1 hypothetical protein FGB90_13920 [Alteribacter natronophilus]
MEIFLLALLISAGGLLLFNYLMGYRKDRIIIDFRERYTDLGDHMKAVREQLEKDGKRAEISGYRSLLIDGSPYLFTERTVNVGGVPLQRTILKPVKRTT